MTLDLINNVALLMAVCWIQSFISYRWNRDSLRAQVASGVLFAFATVTVMMVSILVQPGLWLWVDSSMVVISVSTLLYGPIAGGIAMLTGIAYRLWMGGIGATAGTLSLVLALLAGLLYRALLARGRVGIGKLPMVLFGLLVNGCGALLINGVFMPVSVTESPAYIVSLLVIMAAATVLLGLQLQYIERKKALEREIKANEERLASITQSIPDQLVVVDGQGMLLDVITPAELAGRADELVGEPMAELDPEAYRNHYSLLIAGAMAAPEGTSDIYESRQRYLLDSEQGSEPHFFESNAKRMASELGGDRVVILTRDITERKQAEERIRFLAHYDSMTALPNRHLGLETLDKALVRVRYAHGSLAVALLHLDDLYIVNQSLGAAAGDFLVKALAGRIAAHLGETFVARYSGADFLILAEGIDGTDGIRAWGAELLAAISGPLQFETHEIAIRASLGISRHPEHGDDAAVLIRRATVAAHHARESLENKLRLYDTAMESALTDYVQMRDQLARALERDEFEIHYQPYLSLDGGGVRGVEAFLRWNNPQLGLKSPDYFLDTAERSGLIVPIGDWILRRAAQQAKAWHDAGLDFGALAVNISSAQLTQGNLVEKIRALCDELAINPRLLALEITESSVNRDMNGTMAMTAELKAMGIALSIDDFGTGFSNIQYLRRLKVDHLKIDHEFTFGIETDASKRDIVKAIIQIARALGMTTIAEGVENSNVEGILRDMGCTEAQGYLYTKPLPSHAMEDYLRARRGGQPV